MKSTSSISKSNSTHLKQIPNLNSQQTLIKGTAPDNYYQEKIKLLEEKIRKCEIEKAELDLKISQYEIQNYKAHTDTSNQVTMLFCKENKDLKRQLRDLNQKISLNKIQAVELESFRIRSESAQQTLEFETEAISKKFLIEKENNQKFKEKFLVEKENNKKLRDKYQDLKYFLLTQRNKNDQSLACIRIADFLRSKLKNIIKTVFSYKVVNQGYIQRLKQSKALLLKLIIKKILILKKKSIFSSWSSYTKKKNLRIIYLTKLLNKKLLAKFNLWKRITLGFKDTKLRIKTASRLFTKIFYNKSKYLKYSIYNVWKHKVSEMSIRDLCLLYEEQKIEKDDMIEGFNSCLASNSAYLQSYKAKVFARLAFNKTNQSRIKALTDSLRIWKDKTKAENLKRKSLRHKDKIPLESLNPVQIPRLTRLTISTLMPVFIKPLKKENKLNISNIIKILIKPLKKTKKLNTSSSVISTSALIKASGLNISTLRSILVKPSIKIKKLNVSTQMVLFIRPSKKPKNLNIFTSILGFTKPSTISQKNLKITKFKSSRLLSILKKNKISYWVLIWKKKSHVITKTLNKLKIFFLVITLRNTNTKSICFEKLKNFLKPDKTKLIIAKLVKKVHFKITLRKKDAFDKFKINRYNYQINLYQKDCKEFMNLIIYSEGLIQKAQNENLELKKKFYRARKQLIKYLSLYKNKVEAKKIIFYWYLNRQNRSKILKMLFKPVKNYLYRICLINFKRYHLDQTVSKTTESEVYNHKRLMSADYEVSDSSVLSSSKAIKNSVERNCKVKVFVFVILNQLKKTTEQFFMMLKSAKPLWSGLSIEAGHKVYIKSLRKVSSISSVQSKLFSILSIQNYKQTALKITFHVWKNSKTLYKQLKNPESLIQSEVPPEKANNQQDIIKKLLKENMAMAYKISNAKIKTKNLSRIPDEVYFKTEKENLVPKKRSIQVFQK